MTRETRALPWSERKQAARLAGWKAGTAAELATEPGELPDPGYHCVPTACTAGCANVVVIFRRHSDHPCQ
jgi:hypothetical protein